MATLRHPLVIGSAVAVFVVTVVLNLIFWWLGGPTRLTAEAHLPRSASDIYAAAHRSVVSIDTLRLHPEPDTYEELVGSGVVGFQPDSVFTSYHVVAHAERIHVTFADGTRRRATLKARDRLADVAILQVPVPAGVMPLSPGLTAQPRIGDTVYVIGNPFGLQTSLSSGLISAKERYALPDAGPPWMYRPYLQTDASINHGNSGGPLLDAKGQWIGMATAMVSPTDGSVGVGFCLPIADMIEIISALEKGHPPRHVHLGFDVRQDLTLDEGLRITQIWDESPAAGAGVQVNDVLLKLNQSLVTHPRDVYDLLRRAEPGARVILTLRRGPAQLETEAHTISAQALLSTAAARQR